MPTTATRNKNAISDLGGLDLISQFTSSIAQSKPWDSIIDFATHKSFCGIPLYPRQQTILKLIYLETENMTQYDIDVINSWAETFKNPVETVGVQPDIWKRVQYLKDRGYDHFPKVLSVMGRRASKGMIGGICGAERIANLITLDNPQEHYGLAEGKDLWLNCIATTGEQSKKFLFADIRQAVEGCTFLQDKISTSKEYILTLKTPADVRRLADLTSKGLPVDREIATVRAIAMSSNSASGRGGSAFMNAFDEFAWMVNGTGGPRTAETVWDAYQPSLDQFGKDSFTYVPSSPFSKVGKFFELYKNGTVLLDSPIQKKNGDIVDGVVNQDDLAEELEEFISGSEADPEMLVIQLPSWQPYLDWSRGPELVGRSFKGAIQYEPKEVGPVENVRMHRIERQDPEKFKVERRAQFADVMAGYLDPAKVDAMFDESLHEQTNGKHGVKYHCHIDPSSTNANFAVSVAHLEQTSRLNTDGSPLFEAVVDYMHVYKPEDYPDHTVDYPAILQDLKQLLVRFRSMEMMTFDQWNSKYFIQDLRNYARDNNLPVIVKEVNFNDTRNQKLAERFKLALNMGWIRSYKDNLFDGKESLLQTELKFLTTKNGKVKKQDFGPCTTKDLSDTVQEITTRLLERQILNVDGAMDASPAIGMKGGFNSSSARDTLTNGGSARSALDSLYGGGGGFRTPERGRFF